MISGTLDPENKKARTGRAFLTRGFLAEHTRQGAKAVSMIPTLKDKAQQTTASPRAGHDV